MRRASVPLIPVIVVFLSIAAFLAVMYYGLPTAKKKVATLNTNVVVKSNTNTTVDANTNTVFNTNTTTDATKDWKTYTNSAFSYSIKYPPSYTPTEKDTTGTTTPEHVTFYQGSTRSKSKADIVIYTLTTSNKNSDSFGGEGASWYDWAISGFPDHESDNKRQETYGGKIFTVVNFDPASSWSGSPFYYYVSGTTVYIVVDIRRANNVEDNNVSEIHGMLATLTVTNPTADLPTGQAGWKTYTNSTYNFSFKYPAAASLHESAQPGDSSSPIIEITTGTTGYRMTVTTTSHPAESNKVSNPELYSQTTTKTLNGYTWSVNNFAGGIGDKTPIYYSLTHGSNVYEISFDANVSPVLLDQILSIFTFTK